jgi:hypothetical protein
MAKALRGGDTHALPKRRDGEGILTELCFNCHVEYGVYVGVMEVGEIAVKLLRVQLSKDCPEHSQSYEIDTNEVRISSN